MIKWCVRKEGGEEATQTVFLTWLYQTNNKQASKQASKEEGKGEGRKEEVENKVGLQ
jgi:hypothetical protein